MRNKDINALLSWKLTPQQIVDFNYAYSRRAIFTPVIPNTVTVTSAPMAWSASCMAMKPTVCIASPGLTYNGIWDWGQSKAGVYYEKTNNTRLQEGSTGRVEGMINSDEYATSRLESGVRPAS